MQRSLILACWFVAFGCTEKTPGRILLFDGFGTSSGAQINGRLIENAPPKASGENRGRVDNLLDNVAIFETDEIPGVAVELETLGRKIMVTTDADGLFAAAIPGPLSEGSVNITARAIDAKTFTIPDAVGVLHVLPDRDAVAVISDFDDTIVKTEVTAPLHLLANTLLRNAAQVPLIEGVAPAFEAAQRAGASGFFYLSGCPHNLYERVSEVLTMRNMPRGPVLMKNMGSDKTIEQDGYKTRRLRELMAAFPRMKFVLVGDTGERDPEIYRAIAKEQPGRVAGILIRRTEGSNMDPARFEGCTLIDDYRGDPSPLAQLIRTATTAH